MESVLRWTSSTGQLERGEEEVVAGPAKGVDVGAVGHQKPAERVVAAGHGTAREEPPAVPRQLQITLCLVAVSPNAARTHNTHTRARTIKRGELTHYR